MVASLVDKEQKLGGVHGKGARQGRCQKKMLDGGFHQLDHMCFKRRPEGLGRLGCRQRQHLQRRLAAKRKVPAASAGETASRIPTDAGNTTAPV